MCIARAVGYFTIILVSVCLFAAPTRAQLPFVHEEAAEGGFVGNFSSIVLDAEGHPHIVYWDVGNQTINYAYQVAGVWTNEVIDANGFVGLETSIAVDASGVPHVSFHNFTLTTDVLRYGVRTGGVWSVETVDLGPGSEGRYNDIVVDSQGRPHISYFDATAAELKYAIKDGAWTIETPAQFGTGEFGRYTSITLDGDDRPHIAHVEELLPNYGVTFAIKLNSTWVNAGGLAFSAQDTYTDIAVSNSGSVFRAYYTDAGGDLSVSGILSGSTQVATNGVPGLPISMAIDHDGKIHIVYTRSSLGLLTPMHAEFFISQAVTETVIETDNDRDVGSYVSMDLDRHGLPHVSYQDDDSGDLKYAHASVELKSPLGGETWPVGATRSIRWRGADEIDVALSTDGGSTYEVIADRVSGGGSTFGGTIDIVVPHAPSRFCKIRIRRSSPFSESMSDSLFTIETDIALLNLVTSLPQDRAGTFIEWQTNPGPEDLAGYRLDRRRAGAWSTIVSLTRETSFHDVEGVAGDGYRLFAINGLGGELMLGETAAAPTLAPELTVWPVPFRSGELTISFAPSELGQPLFTEVAVYDVAGRLVRNVARGFYGTTARTVVWDGRDARGQLVPSGVYFVKTTNAVSQQSRKFVVVR